LRTIATAVTAVWTSVSGGRGIGLACRDGPSFFRLQRSGFYGERNGKQVAEGGKRGRREAGKCENSQTAKGVRGVAILQDRKADPPRGRQPPDRQGLWRCRRAGLHRGHARLET